MSFMPGDPLATRLDQQIADQGSIPVSGYVAQALYDPDEGFYAVSGQAGRRGDFLTAPEVGPLFGAVVARAVDEWWNEAGRPPVFAVEEWGAGPGTLARAVVAAAPEVLTTGALRWAQVEVSAAQRAQHLVHPNCSSHTPHDLAVTEAGRVDLIFANELLDNLPFDVASFDGATWHELRVGSRGGGATYSLEVGEPLDAVTVARHQLPLDLPAGTRLPLLREARRWVQAARVRAARVVVVDYGADARTLAARDGGWLRTHVAHEASADWLSVPGSCDITTDLAIEQLPDDGIAVTQAAWLRGYGIDELVDEGRAIWEAQAGIGGLAALKGRSRIREAEALLDPSGMGGFVVLEWPSAEDGGTSGLARVMAPK
jgi:SAM-dependent MidA family methyltransferase